MKFMADAVVNPEAVANNLDPNYTPPLQVAIPLGIQHVLAMFASNVTPAWRVSPGPTRSS
jgi:xanthine/uracil permease